MRYVKIDQFLDQESQVESSQVHYYINNEYVFLYVKSHNKLISH